MGKITRKELGDELNNELDSYSTKNELQTLDNKVMSHKAEVASKTKYGHVKIGNGIDVSNGIISVSDMTASNVSIADVANNFESTTVEGALSELFTNVSDGKSLIGGAITDVDSDVIIPTDPTFQQLADAIGQIQVGAEWAEGTETVTSGKLIVTGLSFKPTVIAIMEINPQDSRDRTFGVYMDRGTNHKSIVMHGGSQAAKIDGETVSDGSFIFSGISSGNGDTVKWFAFKV